MVEVILLQIPPLIRKAFWVCTVYHHNGIVYVEHVLLHGLVLLLLDFIQSSYHGVIVTLVTERLLHVHQQVLHKDILTFIQCVGPFTGVPTETGKTVRVQACLHPWIGQLKDRYIQSCRCQPLLLPTSSVAPASMSMACSLTCSGVPLGVW